MTTAGERVARAWMRHPLVAFVRQRRQIAFYNQFHALLRAGLGMPTVFAELAKFAPDDALSKALRTVSRDIQGGATLADAMARHSGLFEDANIELIAFAEEAGTLDVVLKTLIDYLEQMQKLRWRALMMSIWPLYLAAAFIFVGPLLGAAQRVKSAADVGPMYISGLIGNVLMTGFTVGLVVAAPLLIAAFDVSLPWDRFKRRAPLVSVPMRDLYASRLVMGLGLGIGAGLEVVRVMRVAVKATGSPSLLAALPGAEAVLRKGATLTDAVQLLGVLDRVALGTLSVAERTGTLDQGLTALAANLQESSLRATKLLMLMVVGCVAAGLLFKIVGGMLGVLFGPVKQLYDGAGSGNLDSLGGP